MRQMARIGFIASVLEAVVLFDRRGVGQVQRIASVPDNSDVNHGDGIRWHHAYIATAPSNNSVKVDPFGHWTARKRAALYLQR